MLERITSNILNMTSMLEVIWLSVRSLPPTSENCQYLNISAKILHIGLYCVHQTCSFTLQIQNLFRIAFQAFSLANCWGIILFNISYALNRFKESSFMAFCIWTVVVLVQLEPRLANHICLKWVFKCILIKMPFSFVHSGIRLIESHISGCHALHCNEHTNIALNTPKEFIRQTQKKRETFPGLVKSPGRIFCQLAQTEVILSD